MIYEIKIAIAMVAAFGFGYLFIIGGLAVLGGMPLVMVLTAWITEFITIMVLIIIAGLILLDVYLEHHYRK